MRHNSRTGDYVILLHGLGRTSRSLAPLQLWLRRFGYRVRNVGYSSRRMSVADVVRDSLEPVLAALDLKPGVRVHFVTHSLGGIVFRAWAAGMDPAFPLGRTVMLAPPNRGSEIIDHIGALSWVRLIMGPVVEELGTDAASTPSRLGAVPPDTAVIMGNRATLTLFEHLIGLESDGVVPIKSGRVAGMAAFLVMPTDHTFIMWQPLVLRAVRHFLAHGTFASSPFSAYEIHSGSAGGHPDGGGDPLCRTEAA